GARVVEGTTAAPSRSRPVLPATSRGVGSRMSTGGWVLGEYPRRPIAGARSTLRCARGLDDFAACLRALVGTALVDEPLTLARVLALARVLPTPASPPPLPPVPAPTLHPPALLPPA